MANLLNLGPGTGRTMTCSCTCVTLPCASLPPPHWMPDGALAQCTDCGDAFGALNRRHHCRCCGGIFCSACSADFARVPGFGIEAPARVCERCHRFETDQLPLLLAGDVFIKPGAWTGARKLRYVWLSADQVSSAPPHLRTSAHPHRRTAAPPRLRTLAFLRCGSARLSCVGRRGSLRRTSRPRDATTARRSSSRSLACCGLRRLRGSWEDRRARRRYPVSRPLAPTGRRERPPAAPRVTAARLPAPSAALVGARLSDPCRQGRPRRRLVRVGAPQM